MSQSQPPSHTASLFWLPGTHTHSQGCTVIPAHGYKGTRGHSVFWGATCGPPCTVVALELHGTYPQHLSTWSNSVQGNSSPQRAGWQPPVLGSRPLHDVLHSHPSMLVLSPSPVVAWEPPTAARAPFHPSAVRLLVLVEMDLKEGREYPLTLTRRVNTSHPVTAWKRLMRCLITYPGCNQVPN